MKKRAIKYTTTMGDELARTSEQYRNEQRLKTARGRAMDINAGSRMCFGCGSGYGAMAVSADSYICDGCRKAGR